ncbi:TonB-dependent receptor [Microbulbifer pacificus]|uniref:TonB-dependent receptor n=1 Tax=Microbulbifer pacificus TaxID=407164 RepID=A0AAU0MWW9_9GAMM|nr:TonB-dependent receptor [Microbulbifer pacificus]WOX05018.1 TonB-dependent receptor [Microbulbifer pacificus]
MRRSHLLPGLFLIAPALAVSANSVQESPLRIQETSLETVEVIGKLTHKGSVADSIAGATLDVDTIAQRVPTHPAELINGLPGIWISRGDGQEHLTAIRSPVLSGAGSCGAFAVLEGDIPVRGTGFCNVNQLSDLPLSQAGSVQVLRGPASVLYGSDAQHGVVRLLSAAPAETREVGVSLEGGANDYRRISTGVSDTIGRNGVRLGFSGSHDGGYKIDSGYDQQQFSARHDYRGDIWNTRTLVSISNLNQETAGYVTGLDAYRDSRRRRENPNPEAFRDSQSARLQTRFERATAAGNHWQITPYARHTEMAFLMHYLPGTPLEENGQRGAGIQASYDYRLGENLELLSGLDLEHTNARVRQTQESGFSSFPAGRQYDYQVAADVLAAFSNMDWLFAERSRFTLGARWESLRYDYDNQMLAGDTAEDGSQCINGFTGTEGCRYSRPDDRRDEFSNLSFNAGLAREFANNLSASLRLAHGFRAPQAGELYRLQNGQTVADLDSESIDSVELGLRKNSEGLGFSLTGFYMEKSDVIFQSSERLNLSGGQTRHYGVEYELDWGLAPQWALILAGTYARHQYTNNVSEPGSDTLIETRGNDIDTAPRHMHSLTLGWTPFAQTRVELQFQSMGSYYTDIENAHRYPGHDLLHLRLRQQVAPRINLGVRINNLANVDYAERADYSGLAGGDRYFIGEPRSVFGDVRFEF